MNIKIIINTEITSSNIIRMHRTPPTAPPIMADLARFLLEHPCLVSCVVQDGSSIFDSVTAGGTVEGNTLIVGGSVGKVGGSVGRVVRIPTSGGGGVPVNYNTHQLIIFTFTILSSQAHKYFINCIKSIKEDVCLHHLPGLIYGQTSLKIGMRKGSAPI